MEKIINPKIRTEIVTVNVGASVANIYNFGQLPNIREAKRIERIEAYDASQVALTPDNKTVISNAVLKKTFLKLVERGGSNAEIHHIPLWDISQQQSATKVDNINCQTIDWEKSTINIPDTTGLSANESFVFKVRYEKP